MQSIWICRGDSRNFSFESFGATKAEALIEFAAGLRRHADETGARQSWVDEMITEAEPRQVSIGGFYRDRERL